LILKNRKIFSTMSTAEETLFNAIPLTRKCDYRLRGRLRISPDFHGQKPILLFRWDDKYT
jgi:hypothetical protein